MIVNMIKLHRSFGKVALHWKVHSTVPVRVRAAMVAMEQIMANGLTNRLISSTSALCCIG